MLAAGGGLKRTKEGRRLFVETPVCCGFSGRAGLASARRAEGGGTSGDPPGGDGSEDAARRDSSAILESDRSSGRVPGICNEAAGCDAEAFSASVGSRLLALPLVAVGFLSVSSLVVPLQGAYSM